MERINLLDLVSLSNDYKMSYKYVNYLTSNRLQQYRHEEIKQIKKLIEATNLDRQYFNDFYYSYQIVRLNKEFDLIKISNNFVLNIELKSRNVGNKRILKQLSKNYYYLRLIGLNVIEICYIEKTNTLLELKNNNLEEISFATLKKYLKDSKESRNINLADVYSIDNISASPIQAPLRFIKGEYVLTENQEVAKRQILKSFDEYKYTTLKGDAGTGKTLLLFDLAKELKNSLIILQGELSKNELLIKEKLNLKIITIEEIKDYDFKDIDYILIDEANNLTTNIINVLKNTSAKILFSYDKLLQFIENESDSIVAIIESLSQNVVKLNIKIRISEEINNFINKLLNLSKDIKIDYSKIHFRYFNNNCDAISCAKELKDTCYIDYNLNVYYNQNNLAKKNTYYIYGKEFNKVVMILDDRFYYQNNRLYSINKEYNYKKMLIYFLTRTKKECYIFVTDKKLFKQIEKMM